VGAPSLVTHILHGTLTQHLGSHSCVGLVVSTRCTDDWQCCCCQLIIITAPLDGKPTIRESAGLHVVCMCSVGKV
jgi:hypothetical protein